jgi:hypothetical protein
VYSSVYNDDLTFVNLLFQQPLPGKNLKRSRKHFKLFFHGYRGVCGDNVTTNKVHSTGAGHTVDDMITFDCHADYLSAYDFESEQQQWGGNIRSGTQILPQA